MNEKLKNLIIIVYGTIGLSLIIWFFCLVFYIITKDNEWKELGLGMFICCLGLIVAYILVDFAILPLSKRLFKIKVVEIEKS